MVESKLLKDLALFLIFFLNYLAEELSFLNKKTPDKVAVVHSF